jgi:hypothetical protein
MKKQKQGGAGNPPSSELPRTRTRTLPSVFRTVQSEGLNHPTDNPVFGRRIGTQSLAKTAKEGQELPGNDTDPRRVFVS